MVENWNTYATVHAINDAAVRHANKAGETTGKAWEMVQGVGSPRSRGGPAEEFSRRPTFRTPQ